MPPHAQRQPAPDDVLCHIGVQRSSVPLDPQQRIGHRAFPEPVDGVKFGFDRVFQNQPRLCGQNLFDRADTEGIAPVETGPGGFVPADMRVGSDQVAVRLHRCGHLTADGRKHLLILHVIKHFGADDEILFGWKILSDEVENVKLDVAMVAAPLDRPVDCPLGNIRGRQPADLSGQLFGENPFGAGEFQSLLDPFRDQAQRLRIFDLLVDRDIIPRIGAFEDMFPVLFFRPNGEPPFLPPAVARRNLKSAEPDRAGDLALCRTGGHHCLVYRSAQRQGGPCVRHAPKAVRNVLAAGRCG